MDDGSRARAKIIERINEYQDAAKYHPDMVKFKCLINDKFEEVVAYNNIVDYLKADKTNDGMWKYEEILEHQGPLHSKHKDYNGSSYNVLIRSSNGEIDWQPLCQVYQSRERTNQSFPIGSFSGSRTRSQTRTSNELRTNDYLVKRSNHDLNNN